MIESKIPLRKITGRFYRAVLADRVEHVLGSPGPESAGRYHRLGEPALYITPHADWAVIALGGYMADDGLSRVVVPVELDAAYVVDQHDEAACAALGIDRDLSQRPWRKALEAGEQPPSWRNSDAARLAGADGIIDRSRGIAGGWHVALFRWNELGGPNVKVCGNPIPCNYAESRTRWAAPPEWTMPGYLS